MKKALVSLLSLLLLIAFDLRSQPPNNQDCLGAVAICQTVFSESNAYSGTGNVPNEINSASSCLGTGEKNDVWYTFTVQTSGSLCFTITPNLSSDDYDWAVYNLTTAACSDIFGNPGLEIACNFSPLIGATGPNGLSGGQNEPCMTVTAGEIYVVNVSQFSPSPNGYTIDFSASSASIFDNSTPVIQTIDTLTVPLSCGSTSIKFSFSESVLCSTVNDGDFSLSGPGGPYTLSGVVGAACSSGGTQEITFTANISPAILSGGSYNVCLTGGSGITDLCGNVSPSTCLPFFINGLNVSTVSIIDVICFGASTGSATVAASGGAGAPYTYDWGTVPAQSGATATGLSGGVYSVTATDPDGCSGTGFVTVSEPVVIPDKFDLTCDSVGCDGNASVVPTGGTSPYSYQWLDINNIPIPGETSSSTDSLCAGAWCVEVTDDAGCKDTTCVTIVLPAFTITPTLTSCVGYCDGIATLTELGGVAPFTYQWQNPLGTPLAGETDSILDSLCSGMYYLEVLTGNACTLVDSIQVSDPLTVDVNIATFKDACFGACDGSATTTTSGGSSPYSYTWDDPNAQTTPVATGLCAGIYSVLVTDANSCGPDTAFVTIGQNGEITTTTSVIHTNCDTVNGLATAVVSGGSTPYTYAWNNPGNSTIAIANGLPAGSYQLVVTDSSQCTDTTIVAVGYVDSNVATLSLTKPISCFGACDGEMDVVITGGVPPYEYAWSTKDTAASVDSLCPDTVSVTATDSSGCPATAVLILVEPPPILATIASTSETSCNSQDGTINVTPTGGTIPYTFTWTQLVSTTSTAFDLVAGTYSVTVEDAQGCPPDTVTAVLAVPPPIVPTTTATPATCFGYDDGTVNATIVSGGAAPYTFGWDVSGTVTETDSTSLNSVVVAGTYTVTVTDINNCPTTTSVSVVTEPGPINITLSSFCVDGEGAISTTTTGGTPGYDYIWSDGSIFSNLSMLQPGTYDVTVTDINNCPPDEKGVVILPCLVEIPTAFTPNNDGENDLWLLKNMEYFGDVTISVYNRWGDRVYNHKGGGSLGGSTAYTPWDGKHKLTGANLPTAVYYYVIENVSSEFLVDGSTLVGFVTIIRP